MEKLHLDRVDRGAGYTSSNVMKGGSNLSVRFVLHVWRTFDGAPKTPSKEITMKQVFWTTRRILWSIGVGLVGFFIGGMASGEMGGFLGLIWGASIGFGFGSIFDQTHATKRVIAYWGATIALVGPFFSLIFGGGVFPYDDSVVQQIAIGAIGAAVGGLFGVLLGIVQLKRLRRRLQGSQSRAVV